MSNPDITRNLNAAEVEFALEEPLFVRLRTSSGKADERKMARFRNPSFETLRFPPIVESLVRYEAS